MCKAFTVNRNYHFDEELLQQRRSAGSMTESPGIYEKRTINPCMFDL